MLDETIDAFRFDEGDEDLDAFLSASGLADRLVAGQRNLSREEALDASREEIRGYLAAVRDHSSNRIGGGPQWLGKKRHYNLNKGFLSLLELALAEAVALTASAAIPVALLGAGAPLVLAISKWREVATTLDDEELAVMRAMTKANDGDLRILREKGVTSGDIEKAFARMNLTLPPRLDQVLKRLCGEVGDKKVCIRTIGGGGEDRFTPIR